MKSTDSRDSLPGRAAILISAGAVPILMSILMPSLVLLSAGALAACGSSSSGDGFGEFEGTWRTNFGNATTPSPSTFALNCPTAGMAGRPAWDRVVLEPGTVSDITETAGPDDCQFPLDVAGKVATVPSLDPYTMAAPQCTALIDSGTDAAGDFHLILFEMKVGQWAFSLLQPTKGQPPPGQLSGTAGGRVLDLNASAGTFVDLDTACTYKATVRLDKIAD